MPLGVGVVDLQSNAIEISWHPGVGDFTNYLVTYEPVGATPATTLISRTGERQIRFTGLQPGTQYTITLSQQGGSQPLQRVFTKTTSKLCPPTLTPHHVQNALKLSP